jgi:predicted enzyme related to lactoylglutathione lyase
MPTNNKINYVEFAARDIAATKAFFQTVFDWQFTDYGPDYVSFADAGLDGGFYRADLVAASAAGSALVILYTDALEAVESKVVSAGGKITKPIFAFPGGRRFHFTEPSGNELAVWTDVGL